MPERTLTRREKREQDLLWTVEKIYWMSGASAADLEGFNTYTLPTLHSLLKACVGRGYLDFVETGQTFSVQARYFVIRKGLDFLSERLGMRPTRQSAEAEVPWHFRHLRSLEVIYRLAPRLFRCGAVRVPSILPLDGTDRAEDLVLDQDTRLERLALHSGTSGVVPHCITQYRTRRNQALFIPIIWIGLHHGDFLNDYTLRSFFGDLDTRPGFHYGIVPAAPVGAVFVVIDRLAGLAVKLAYPDLPKAIVTAEGELAETLDPVPPVGIVEPPAAYAGPVGHPEQALNRLRSNPVFAALTGVPNRKVFEWIHSYPSSQRKDLARGVGQPPAQAGRLIRDLESPEIVAVLDGRPVLAKAGRNNAAQRDRRHPNIVHRRLGIYTDPDSPHRLNQRGHDAVLGTLASLCHRDGIFAGAGWRLEISYPGDTMLKPDLWVLVPIGDGLGLWHPLEAEMSAFAPSSVINKVSPIRVAKSLGGRWPYLFVAGKGGRGDKAKAHDLEAAQRFANIGSDLDLLAIPANIALRHGLASNESSVASSRRAGSRHSPGRLL